MQAYEGDLIVKPLLTSAVVFAILMGASLAHAQTPQRDGDIGTETYLDYLRTLERLTEPQKPAVSVGVQSAFGLGFGVLSAGGALTDRQERGVENADASGAIGLGLGNSETSMGVELTIGLISVQPPWITRGSDFGEDGNLNVKLFRSLPDIVPIDGARSSVAVGAANAIAWGDPETIDPNYFVVGSTLFEVTAAGERFPINLSVGAGTAVKGLERDPGVFAGAGLGLTQWASIGAGYAGDETLIGLTLIPKIIDGVSMSVGFTVGDVFEESSERRLILTGGLAAKVF
jgi:hypothetical protein